MQLRPIFFFKFKSENPFKDSCGAISGKKNIYSFVILYNPFKLPLVVAVVSQHVIFKIYIYTRSLELCNRKMGLWSL